MSRIPKGISFPSIPEIFLLQTLREKDPSGPDSDEDQFLPPLVLFQDLIGDARQGTVDSLRIHDDLFLLHGFPHSMQLSKKSLPLMGEGLTRLC